MLKAPSKRIGSSPWSRRWSRILRFDAFAFAHVDGELEQLLIE
jgi:hypothetical protein